MKSFCYLVRSVGVLWVLVVLQASCDEPEQLNTRMRSIPPEGTPIESVSAEDLLAFEGDYVIGRAAAILATRTHVIVGDRRGDPRVIVYDRNAKRPIQRLGRSGGGPGEVGDPTSLHLFHGSEDSVQLVDISRRRISVYSLTSKGLTFVRHLPLPVDVMALDALPLQHGYALTGFLSDAAVYIADHVDDGVANERPNTYRKLGRPPHAPKDGNIMASPSFANVDPSGERIALGYLSSSALQFLRTDGSFAVLATDTVGLRVPITSPEERVSYIVDVVATAHRVMALFCGCRGANELPSEILVYDWDGNLRGVMVLDHEVYSIGVTSNGRLVFGGIEDPEPSIGVWEVPNGW